LDKLLKRKGGVSQAEKRRRGVRSGSSRWVSGGRDVALQKKKGWLKNDGESSKRGGGGKSKGGAGEKSTTLGAKKNGKRTFEDIKGGGGGSQSAEGKNQYWDQTVEIAKCPATQRERPVTQVSRGGEGLRKKRERKKKGIRGGRKQDFCSIDASTTSSAETNRQEAERGNGGEQ